MSASNKQWAVVVIMTPDDGQPDAHMLFSFQLIYMYFFLYGKRQHKE